MDQLAGCDHFLHDSKQGATDPVVVFALQLLLSTDLAIFAINLEHDLPEHGLAWHEAEVINHPNGKPAFLFRGAIADLVDGASVHLSLSHDAGIASAMVVLER